METMAAFTPDVVDALNALLEDERASVEMAVALACGATEIAERDTLAAMGIDDIATCESLRLQMEAAAAPVTRRINGVVFQVLGEERYDDRLRAYAHHQRIVADRCRELLATLALDEEARALAQRVSDAHQRHSAWCDQRADVFSATRIHALAADAPQPADTAAFGAHDADQQPTPPAVDDPAHASHSSDEYDTPADQYLAAELPHTSIGAGAPGVASEAPRARYSVYQSGETSGSSRLRTSARIRGEKRVDGE